MFHVERWGAGGRSVANQAKAVHCSQARVATQQRSPAQPAHGLEDRVPNHLYLKSKGRRG